MPEEPHPEDRAFAEAVGVSGQVTVAGLGTRGGPVPGVRAVRAPRGVRHVDAAEMIVRCAAGTPVEELLAALGPHGQTVAMPPSGTVGGALAAGRSTIDRLGHGPMRDALLQARYASSAGELVTIGGPTVKNVSGFDLCRLFVGSWGTLGFFAEVILRTRPLPRVSRWFQADSDPFALLDAMYRPSAVLWDGASVWVHLEGEEGDVDALAERYSLRTAAPPTVPTAARSSHPPGELPEYAASLDHPFVAEVGVGVVHHGRPVEPRTATDPAVVELHERIKQRFDPAGRLNPGISPLRPPR